MVCGEFQQGSTAESRALVGVEGERLNIPRTEIVL